jgi:hypothetical protein
MAVTSYRAGGYIHIRRPDFSKAAIRVVPGSILQERPESKSSKKIELIINIRHSVFAIYSESNAGSMHRESKFDGLCP